MLKWGVPGGGIKSAKVAPTPYVYYPPEPGWYVRVPDVRRYGCVRYEYVSYVLRASIPRASAYREPERAPRETVARGVKSRPKKVEHTPL